MSISIVHNNSDNVNNFNLILQGVPINSLMMIQNKNLQEDRFTHTAETTVNGVTITIRNYNNLKIDAVTFRFLDYLLVKTCHYLPYNRTEPVPDDKLSKWQVIKISVADFMQTTDLNNQARTKNQIANSLTALQNISLSWSEKVYKKKKTDYVFFNTNIVTAFESVRGGYVIQFDIRFLRYLSSYAFVMPFYIELFKINLHKHPHSYFIARRLLLHLNMNQKKSNSNIISVKSLLESLNLPTYSEILNTTRQHTLRIRKPFERDMNHLKEISFLSNWSYRDDISDFKKWLKSSLTYIIKNYPLKNNDK